MAEITIAATLDNLDTVLAFVDQQMEEAGCAMKLMAQVDMAVEEIFVNIAHYAYPPDQTGWALIRCQVEQDPLRIQVQFVDGGVPFNPLAKKDADITLSAEERNIGGLGILMVKRSMDAVDYVYSDGKNILTLTKRL